MKSNKLGILIYASIGVLLFVLIYPALNKPDKFGPKGLTRAKMLRLERYILAYYHDFQAWPDADNWRQQLRPYLEKDTVFSLDKLLADGWGNEFMYELDLEAADNVRVLRSFGLNGKDDRGKKDDLILNLSRPK